MQKRVGSKQPAILFLFAVFEDHVRAHDQQLLSLPLLCEGVSLERTMPESWKQTWVRFHTDSIYGYLTPV